MRDRVRTVRLQNFEGGRYLLDEHVKLLSDLPAGIPPFGRDALQLDPRQAGNAAPRKQLCNLDRDRREAGEPEVKRVRVHVDATHQISVRRPFTACLTSSSTGVLDSYSTVYISLLAHRC